MHSLAHTKMLAIAIAAWRMNVATPDVAVHNERMRIAIVDESAGRAAVIRDGLATFPECEIHVIAERRELVARIHAVLRRTAPEGAGGTLEAGPLAIDTNGHRVTANGATVTVGPTEYRLLKFFMENPDRVYTRGQVLDRVWGGSVYIEERTVDVHVRRLRKALEPAGCDWMVQTVRGSGYRFSARPE